MGMKRQFALGMLLGFGLAACAGASFPYKYYGVDLTAQMLRGPSAADDIGLAVCDATQSDASPCTAMMTQDYLALKQDYLNISEQLITCQQQLK